MHRDGRKDVDRLQAFLLPPRLRALEVVPAIDAGEAGKLKFFAEHAHLADGKAFAAFLAPPPTVICCFGTHGGATVERDDCSESRAGHRAAISDPIREFFS